MKNLIIGIVFDLTIHQLTPFLVSARRYHTDNICIITPETDTQILELYKKYNVHVHITNISSDRHVAFKQRLEIINSLLKTTYSDINKVFFTDIRDVYFFGNIFDFDTTSNITFFAEPCLMVNCSINTRWYEMTYNLDEVNKVKDKVIICNGTILSTKDSMITYSELMLDQINKCNYVMDQPITNYVIHNNLLTDYTILHHGKGPIGTFTHDANMAHCILNDHKVYNKVDNSNVLVVHQYDRCPVLDKYITNCCFFENNLSNRDMYIHCTNLYNNDQQLIEFRKFIVENKFGYLDNEHSVMWDKLVHNLSNNFKFIEIGVYKGQVMTLIAMFCKKYNLTGQIYGVSPLNGAGDKYTVYDDSNYLECIKTLHSKFNVPFNEDQIIRGLSTDDDIKNKVKSLGKFNIVYVDGGHDYETVVSDINLAKEICDKNGYIVMDDSSNFLTFDGLDIFKGHPEVSSATTDHLMTDVNFIEKSCVGHNRIFQKIV